jgi:hypothetical protein
VTDQSKKIFLDWKDRVGAFGVLFGAKEVLKQNEHLVSVGQPQLQTAIQEGLQNSLFARFDLI